MRDLCIAFDISRRLSVEACSINVPHPREIYIMCSDIMHKPKKTMTTSKRNKKGKKRKMTTTTTTATSMWPRPQQQLGNGRPQKVPCEKKKRAYGT